MCYDNSIIHIGALFQKGVCDLAEKRKDRNGRVLKTGENQRKNGTYEYRYSDGHGKIRSVYGKTLEALRKKEEAIQRDMADGIDYTAGEITVSELVGRYMNLKRDLSENTRRGYGTVINRINAPDVSADFAFAADAELLEIIFPQILDCDAAFLRCGGETMLIDCATSGQAQRILNMFKQLGITHVDKIVNTHPHADHIGGFAELIKEITVDELWLCFPAEETVHCANAMKAAERAGVTVRMFGDGDTLTLGTATMQVWMLDKPEYTRLNDRSAQIMLTFGQRKMLFSADLEQKGQNGLIKKVGAEMLKADVLKYPHHGLQGLTPEYRAAVSPELAIVTCNQRETEGKKYIRRTALDTVWTVPGFIHLTTDGEMWVCDRIVSDVKY